MTRHTSHLTRHTSHVTHHTSHLPPPTSHYKPHTSHVTRSHVLTLARSTFTRSHVHTFSRSHVHTFTRSHVQTIRSHVHTFTRLLVHTLTRSHVYSRQSHSIRLVLSDVRSWVQGVAGARQSRYNFRRVKADLLLCMPHCERASGKQNLPFHHSCLLTLIRLRALLPPHPLSSLPFFTLQQLRLTR